MNGGAATTARKLAFGDKPSATRKRAAAPKKKRARRTAPKDR